MPFPRVFLTANKKISTRNIEYRISNRRSWAQTSKFIIRYSIFSVQKAAKHSLCRLRSSPFEGPKTLKPPALPEDTCFWGIFTSSGLQNVNNLTIAALDPLAKIPEYRACAIRLEPV
jgi:hypothetical protein